MSRTPRAAYQAALKRAGHWLERRNDVVAVGLGLKREAGEASGEQAILVTVRWKRTPKRLQELRIKPLPRSIQVRVGTRTHRVPVDVRDAGGRVAGRPHGLVACPLDTTTQVFGMVGAVVTRQASKFILTAAHVARQVGIGVIVVSPQSQVQGTVSERFTGPDLDHALVAPASVLPASASRLPQGEQLSGVRLVSQIVPGDQAFLRTRNGSLQQVVIERVQATVDFNMPWGRVPFHETVSTPITTTCGDSGTLLYDNDFKAIGTLLGGFEGNDWFVPCEPSFQALNVELSS
jgi:hypothetical protein